jgi:amidase
MDVEEYIAASRTVAECRHRVRALFDGVDALIYPAAEGEAEAGIQNSGSPRFGALWTLLHLPTVAFPIGRGPTNLPLGVQLVGDFGDDIALLNVADAMQAWADY